MLHPKPKLTPSLTRYKCWWRLLAEATLPPLWCWHWRRQDWRSSKLQTQIRPQVQMQLQTQSRPQARMQMQMQMQMMTQMVSR